MNGQEIELRFRRAAAKALNTFADGIAADAIPETPLRDGTLRASEMYPAKDVDGVYGHRATEEDLTAMVSFNTVYAAAQHEGEALQERQIGVVHWVVHHYTEPGTKDHFLEDPYKAKVPRMELFIAAFVKREMAL